jgi:hypothetical protein
MISEEFRRHLEIAKQYFESNLPYWCDDFSRPTDQEFATYLKLNGFSVQYLVLEIFEQVYIPSGCDLDSVIRTGKIRRALKEKGTLEAELPILIK